MLNGWKTDQSQNRRIREKRRNRDWERERDSERSEMRWSQLHEETLNLLGLRKPCDRNPGIGRYLGWTGVAKLKPHLKHSLISTTWELSCPDQTAGSLLSSPAMLFPAAPLWEMPVSLMVSLRDTESQVPGTVPLLEPRLPPHLLWSGSSAAKAPVHAAEDSVCYQWHRSNPKAH